MDVRIVAATNRKLREVVEKKLFSDDLYFRLPAFTVTVPPHCERSHDALLREDYLPEKFAQEFSKPRPEVSPACRQLLLSYPGPGNVRELSNAIERAATGRCPRKN